MINEFKAIAKRAKGILYGFDVYKFNLDYDDGESLVIYNDNSDEDAIVIPYKDIKVITYDKGTREYTICYDDLTWGENFKITFNFLTIM